MKDEFLKGRMKLKLMMVESVRKKLKLVGGEGTTPLYRFI